MSKISDELRKCADTYDDKAFLPKINGRYHDLADRIDTEMVELPRGRDGKPIHFGDTVFTTDDHETSWCVRYIELRRDGEPSIGIESSRVNTYRPPSCITHERPDSLERIANEIAGAKLWCDSNGTYNVPVHSVSSEQLDSWAERIRRLAEREASNGTD